MKCSYRNYFVLTVEVDIFEEDFRCLGRPVSVKTTMYNTLDKMSSTRVNEA